MILLWKETFRTETSWGTGPREAESGRSLVGQISSASQENRKKEDIISLPYIFQVTNGPSKVDFWG